MNEQEKEVVASIDKRKEKFAAAADQIWDFAETRFEEYKSSELLQKLLTDEGFEVKSDLADMKTCFVASWGSGKPVIGFLGEFDALYGLSQKADVAKYEPLVEGGKGHGCGHNGLGMGSLAAAVAMKDYMEAHHIQGTVRYFGCPGEEGGSGKVYMARAGLFKGVDAAFTWHPGIENTVRTYNFQACICAYFKFTGRAAHAAGAPHLGRSALDAVELMGVGCNYLREHVPEGIKFHYAITDTGGLSPNVVQPHAAVLYQIRAPHVDQAREIYERVIKVAKGAAMMTETQLEVVFDRASSEMLPNVTLEKVLYDAFSDIGAAPVDAEDHAFAQKIRESLTEAQKQAPIDAVIDTFGEQAEPVKEKLKGKDICDFVYPWMPTDICKSGSSDVGDASHEMPTAQIMTATWALGTPGHSWQAVAQGKRPLFHKAFMQAGKVLGAAGVQVLTHPDVLQKAKDEFAKKIAERPYVNPIPDEVKPSPVR